MYYILWNWAKRTQVVTIYSFKHMDLQDIPELFVSKSDFMDNHFTNCSGGGGAISIAVGVVKQFH